jgi:threonine dehydratase
VSEPAAEPWSMLDYVRHILSARVYDLAVETPLDRLDRMSERLGRPVFLKREDLQPVFSFKVRGAFNKLSSLDPDALAKGVACASAGNHAQGVAMAAAKLGVRAVIVMPTSTPAIKLNAVRRLGGEAVLFGDSFDDANEHAGEIAAREGLTIVHPFDDPYVIAGQGTIGVELLRQHPDPIGAIYIPVGGGGLAAGIAAYVKFLRPDVSIYGVEPDDAAAMAAAFEEGAPVTLDTVGQFVDGVAVRRTGHETFRLCRELLDGIVTVTTDEVCTAIKDIFDDTRAIAEPAGALALAGMRRHAASGHAPDGPLIVVNSGANTNFDRLRHVVERVEIGERGEALLAVQIPEVPGSYRAFTRLLGPRQITEFNYRYAPGASAEIFVGIQLRDGESEKAQVIELIRRNGHTVADLSDNEVARLHVRFMVGGRVADLQDEIAVRFEFPERPGALFAFVEGLRSDWNITLFHYRNHGADHGRVLAGIQVPPDQRAEFFAFLDSLGYPYWDESDDIAYRLFLGNG